MNNTNDQFIQNLKKTDWHFPIHLIPFLTDYEKSFVEAEFIRQRSLKDYLQRIDYLGFTGQGKILDAGCGMGQWSLALAKLNDEVAGIDISSSRLMIAKELMTSNNMKNINLQYAPIEHIPFTENTFDAVFCYSVIMFAHIPNTLAEFFRVLKPGGKLYVMTDLWPWYLYMKKNYGVYISIVRMLKNTLLFKENNRLFTESWFLNQVKKAGFVSIKSFNDGYGSFKNTDKPPKNIIFYPQDSSKLKYITEVLAQKPLI